MSVDALRDGFVRMCFDSSLNAYSGGCRVLLEGQYIAPTEGGPAPNQPIRVASKRDISKLFGEGSVLSESLRVAFGCCSNNAVEIWALPRADSATGVAAAYTLTLTGPAGSDGRIDLYMGDANYNISVRVEEGATAAEMATAIVAALPGNFPFTGVAAEGVITLTARNKGTVGNFLRIQYNWHGRLNYAPTGVAVTVAQTVQGSVDPVPLDYGSVLGECCYCCVGMLYGNTAWQDGMIRYLNDSWDCDKPQCFGHGYTYNTGTLGQILATFTDDATVSRLVHSTSDPILPYLKAAAYAVKSCCATVNNPEISIQGPDYGVLNCVLAPASCSQGFNFDEQEQLREAGFVVTVPVTGGEGVLTSPMVTNDITNNLYDDEGRDNSTFRDVSSRRLAAQTAEAFAIKLQEFNGLGFYTKNTNIPAGTFGTNPRLMLSNLRAWATNQVGILFSEFDNLDEDLTLQTDFETAPQCQGQPGVIGVTLQYRPPVRIKRVGVNLKPRLLDNCNV